MKAEGIGGVNIDGRDVEKIQPIRSDLNTVHREIALRFEKQEKPVPAGLHIAEVTLLARIDAHIVGIFVAKKKDFFYKERGGHRRGCPIGEVELQAAVSSRL